LALCLFGTRLKRWEHEAVLEKVQARLDSGGSVCLNSFSGLISGIPAVVIKMMDP